MVIINKERIDSIRTMAYKLKLRSGKIDDVECAIAVMGLCDDWHWSNVAKSAPPSVDKLSKAKPVGADVNIDEEGVNMLTEDVNVNANVNTDDDRNEYHRDYMKDSRAAKKVGLSIQEYRSQRDKK
jgi:hypothetical protein